MAIVFRNDVYLTLVLSIHTFHRLFHMIEDVQQYLRNQNSTQGIAFMDLLELSK